MNKSSAKLIARKTAGFVSPGGLPSAQCQLPPSSAPTIERCHTRILSRVLALSSAVASRAIGVAPPSKFAQVLMLPSCVTNETLAPLAPFVGLRTPLMTAVKSPTHVPRLDSSMHAG